MVDPTGINTTIFGASNKVVGGYPNGSNTISGGNSGGGGGGGGGGTTTFDPANLGTNLVLSNGNLTVAVISPTGFSFATTRSITSHSTGKFYFEITNTAIVGSNMVAIGIVNASASLNTYAGIDDNGAAALDSGSGFFINNSPSGTTPAFSQGQTIGIAFDAGAQLIWLRNITVASTVWNAGGTANPATGIGGISFSAVSGPYFAAASINTGQSNGVTVNFGATSYAATAPVGFGNL